MGEEHNESFRPVPGSERTDLQGVRHVVAVASGKGGVGKTTVAVNLALALSHCGRRIGLMDGDIYGPNVPLMLGVAPDSRPGAAEDGRIEPLEILGLKMISMGILVPADQPMVWRGPMLHKAISQFLRQVVWGALDVLLVDLPPGTGDVQLSLVQNVSLTGAVIVTTPQEVALLDARKGIAMFQRTGVPVLGVVENMSGEIFGKGGGQKMAEDLKVPYLGGIGLDPRIREGGDLGRPAAEFAKDSEAAVQFMGIAKILTRTLDMAAAVRGG